MSDQRNSTDSSGRSAGSPELADLARLLSKQLTIGDGRHNFPHWETRAAVAQENWRDTADYGILWTLGDPDRITYRAANDTFCYSRKILLIDDRNNEVVGSYFPKVSVARVSHRIITAYPSGSQC